jgi:2-amino-4-hydroxy-6-hydroxymethyldihydropteridine diphosphokinase
MPERAYLAIGSNLEDRQAYLEAGLAAIAALPEISIAAVSSIYETPPLGPAQPDYLNAVFAVDTALAPARLLSAMLKVEECYLRQRQIHWGPRTLDLDLLLYATHQMQSPSLTLPHPHMTERCFVLVPLCEIAPDLVHPSTGRSFAAHLAQLDCSAKARKVGPLSPSRSQHV